MSRRVEARGNVIVVLLAVLVLAIGCGTPREVNVDANDNGSQIELEQGQILVITLESNPSTGYRWEVVEFEEPVLQQMREAVLESSDPKVPPPPGTGGTETFRFEAISAGK